MNKNKKFVENYNNSTSYCVVLIVGMIAGVVCFIFVMYVIWLKIIGA
jgi:hypothetical protein